MSNFKSGSGNLDFGGSDDDEEESDHAESAPQTDTKHESGTSTDDQTSETSKEDAASETETQYESSSSDVSDTDESRAEATSRDQYPYFIRRSNVGDERDTRLEIHVRDKVADQEPAFRNELAEHLDVNEVSKTDAREFALLAAFENPERVAELMRDEEFGAL